jgi:hypothetical protein
MLSLKTMPFLMIGALAVAGCAKNTDETTTKTVTETKTVGSTQESTTKTSVDSPSGDTKAVTKSYVGTVTQYVPGKSIEVMTGDKDTHSFDLAEKDDVVTIDAKVAVGSKVQLVEETKDGGGDRITVTIAPAA